jgi:hypothetical protein
MAAAFTADAAPTSHVNNWLARTMILPFLLSDSDRAEE